MRRVVKRKGVKRDQGIGRERERKAILITFLRNNELL
jgi:hypothetical protein